MYSEEDACGLEERSLEPLENETMCVFIGGELNSERLPVRDNSAKIVITHPENGVVVIEVYERITCDAFLYVGEGN